MVESCDVLLQVVDARDPLGCRLTHLEQDIRSRYGEDKKRVVMVLNKVDLVPHAAVVQDWVRYFTEHEHIMCVPFSAAGRSVRASAGSSLSYVAPLFRCLRSVARAECGSGARRAIVVGVIGYPNVGKSSVINALKRRPVVGVGNTPGFTTGNTEVDLRSDIRILDCPGVVAPGEDSGDVVLRNAVRVSSLANPFVAVQRLLQRCATSDAAAHTPPSLPSHTALGHDANTMNRNQDTSHHNKQAGKTVCESDAEAQRVLRATGVHPLALFYGIDAFDPSDTYDFVRKVGLRRGRLIKGGVVDEEMTARMILSDWNDGRIPYYTYPPDVDVFCNGVMTARDVHRPGDAGTSSVSSSQWMHATSSNAEDEEEHSLSPQLVSGASCGLTVDGFPSFHFSFQSAARGRFGKWASEPTPPHAASEADSDGDDIL